MSRTYCLIVLVAVMLVLALPVQAEYTARVLGMGNTALAVGNDSAAWFNNPALLPDLATDGLLAPWPNRMSVGAEVGGDFHDLAINFSCRDAARNRGWGVGYEGQGGNDSFGAGYGQTCSFVDGLNWGVSGVSIDNGVNDEFLFNIGLAYDVPMPVSKLVVAAEVWDVTDRFDTQIDLGAAYYLPMDLTLALDVYDVNDASVVNFGAEYAGPGVRGFVVRAGSSDGDLTAGLARVMGPLEVGVGWIALDGPDDFIFATAEASL